MGAAEHAEELGAFPDRTGGAAHGRFSVQSSIP